MAGHQVHTQRPSGGVSDDVPGRAGTRLLDQLGDGRTTFRAQGSDGSHLVARRLDIPDPEVRQRVAATLRRVREAQPPGVVPVLAVEVRGDVLWMVRAYDAGLPLHRLVTLASPTAAQVGALGMGMLEAVRGLHAAGVTHGAIHGGNVLVDRDGSVRLADAGMAAAMSGAAPAQARRADLAAVAAVLREVWRPGRRSSAPQLAALLDDRRLERARSAAAAAELLAAAAGDVSTAGLGLLASRLLAGGGEGEWRMGGGDRSAGADEGESASNLALQEALVADRRRRRVRAAVVAAAAAVAVGLGITGGLALMRHDANNGGARGAAPATAAASSRPAATASPPPTRPATPGQTQAPAPAPPAAGIIGAAALTSQAPCHLGGACTLTSRLNLLAHAGEEVAWEVLAVDECTGVNAVLYEASIFAVPDYQYVYDTRTANIPASHPVVLYTVSTVPTHAASAPLMVGSGSCT
jgi:hypothetical protein